MADYFSPTVIQPTIPAADITALERLLLSHIFNAEPDGEDLYFYADERPADLIWLARTQLDAALARSPTATDSAATAFVTEQLARVPADNVEIELDLSGGWEFIFQDIVRRSRSLRYVTAVCLYLLEDAARRFRRHGCPHHGRCRHGQVHQRYHRGLPE
jgi:hypothetical protein